MAFPFQIPDVVRPLRVNATRAIAVSIKLQRRAPKALSANARQQLSQLRTHTDTLDELQKGAAQEAALPEAKPAFRAWMAAWSILRSRLNDAARLEAMNTPEAAQARVLLDTCVPDGATFSREDAAVAWLKGKQIFDVIARDNHNETLEHVAGDFVLRAVRATHHALGVALGLMGSVRPLALNAAPTQRELIDKITHAIASYALQLIASTDPSDEDAVQATAYALEPIEECRAQSRARRSEQVGDESESEEETPRDATPNAGSAQPATPAEPTTPAQTTPPDAAAANDATPPTARVAQRPTPGAV
jgi:hypothetical protein